MVLKFLIPISFFLLFSCSNSENTENFTETEQAPADPKALYTIHCETCHGAEGNQGTSGAADLSKSKFSDSQVKNVILNGNEKGMMPYKDIIDTRDIDSLVEFVKRLRK